MEIKYTKLAVKFLKSTDVPTRHRILRGINGLIKDPPVGDIKPLKGYHDSYYRLRIGKYRIIYRYEKKILRVDDINSRGDIYK